MARKTTKRKTGVKKATQVDATFAVAAALSRIGDVLEVLAQRYIVEDPPEPEQPEPEKEATDDANVADQRAATTQPREDSEP